MTFKQKILKTVYPAMMWFSKKTGAGKVSENKSAIPSVSFYSLSDTSISGKPFSLDQLKGKKVLLVNTASDCGFTAQYEDLEKLNKQYQGKLMILGFPSNDFSEQEKGDDASIASFCKINYGVTFPLMKKSVVKKNASQNVVFKWLSDQQQNGWNSNAPGWNFCKYLVNEEGKLTHVFQAAVEPLGPEITAAIE